MRQVGSPFRWAPFRWASVLALPLLVAQPAQLRADPVLFTSPGDGGTLNFGNVLVEGTPGMQVLTVRNNGTLLPPPFFLVFTIPAPGSPFVPNVPFTDIPLAPGAEFNFPYLYLPTVRGTNSQAVAITSNGGNATITFTGRGVAPMNQVTTNNAGLTRIGTSNNASITVRNVGDGNLSGAGAISNLLGALQPPSGSPNFSGPGPAPIVLADGGVQTFNYTFNATDRAVHNTTVALNFLNGSSNGTNQAQVVSASLSGQGVGPIYQSNPLPGSILDFGTVLPGTTVTLPLTISNITNDPNGGNELLTRLTLVNAIFGGSDSAAFSAPGLAGSTLDKGDSQTFNITFTAPNTFGDIFASLVITTDENAALGAAGRIVPYQLRATVLPEPGSIALLGVGAAGLCWYSWRRWRAGAG